MRVDPAITDLPEDAGDRRNPFEGVVLTLQRDDERIRRRIGVQCQQPQRRRAIQQDHVEGPRLPQWQEGLAQSLEVVIRPRQLHLRPAQVHFAGDDAESGIGRSPHALHQATLAQQGSVNGAALDLVETDAGRGVGLGIKVNEEDPQPHRRKAGRQVDGGGGFADATLLVGNGDHMRRHTNIKRDTATAWQP